MRKWLMSLLGPCAARHLRFACLVARLQLLTNFAGQVARRQRAKLLTGSRL